MNDQEALRGLVFDIQRFAIHDGPGIRTTVFLKGCPLTCLWCHNPESRETQPEIFFTPEKCVGCLFCVRACERKGHRMEGGKHEYDRTACVRCGKCTRECYAGALEVVGKEMTVRQVTDEVVRDRVFYENSGGGLTVSGGEPLRQFAFTQGLLLAAKASGLHTCLETSGCGAAEELAALTGCVDLFLYDVKETDPARHRECTGVASQPLLENLEALDRAGARLILRCPIIPGLNDRAEHFEALGRLAERLRRVESLEVLPYHPLGISKNRRLGKAPRWTTTEMPADTTVKQWLTAIRGATSKAVR
jgi:glycyl-radical enzyme activating protein